ncbi:hypothetical protein [Paraburkholderia unamae]|uniref:Uncharacterized protein n=1 Tax=Paraburkholderia unamae TaxID=219649 RepID=A0ABX5KJE9_9BURK|nr:hypothetical protein [Paraburkholderia unamae]PVX77158.1 hypothetical protein C7402_115217 [Paraburkholderia unamae]
MDDELIEGRFELHEALFEHCSQRLDALEEDREANHARVINWAMLGLFVIEVVIGIAEIWLMVRHA